MALNPGAPVTQDELLRLRAQSWSERTLQTKVIADAKAFVHLRLMHGPVRENERHSGIDART